MKTFWLLITILMMGLAISGQDIERKYDRFKDETNVSMLIGNTQMDANFNSLALSLSSTFTGQTIPADPPVMMSLVVTSKEWKLLRADLTMRAIVDGQRLTIGEFKRNFSSVYHGATMEAAVMPVSIQTLKKLVAGQKVELQFMGSETVANRAELDKIKSFLEALGK